MNFKKFKRNFKYFLTNIEYKLDPFLDNVSCLLAKLNPCHIRADGSYKKLYHFFAFFTKGSSGCDCCLGARILFAFILGAVISFLI